MCINFRRGLMRREGDMGGREDTMAPPPLCGENSSTEGERGSYSGGPTTSRFVIIIKIIVIVIMIKLLLHRSGVRQVRTGSIALKFYTYRASYFCARSRLN